jgi:hypothetical protein
MAIDWTYYNQQVLSNPTATPEAKARAAAFFNQQPQETSEIRNLQMSEGEPLALAKESNDASSYQKFNSALMDMLKKYQELGTKQSQENILKQSQENILNMQNQQAGKILEQTPQSLIGASPSLQAQARGAEASALNPSIEGMQGRQRTFSELLAGFGDALSQARAIGQWMEESEMAKRKEKQALVLAYPGAVKAMPDKERAQFLKDAGISQDFLDSIAKSMLPKEEKLSTQVVDLNGKKVLINSQTGEIIQEYSLEGGDKKEGESNFFSNTDLTTINNLLNSVAFSGAVGGSELGRFTTNWTAKQDFIADVERIVSQMSLEALIKAKANGATFGALSEGEWKILGAAATNLGAKSVKDKKGNIVGYSGSEQSFRQELQRIKDLITKAVTPTASAPNSFQWPTSIPLGSSQMFNQQTTTPFAGNKDSLGLF